jgi:sortase A
MPLELTPEQAAAAHFVVGPRDSWILDDYGDNRLTLMACHPKYSARQRIVVVAELVGAPAPTPEEPPAPLDANGAATELLGNDEGALLPAILWGLAAALVAFAAWWLARVWRRWPAYLLATPVFLILLFGCFTQVERLLPAAY